MIANYLDNKLNVNTLNKQFVEYIALRGNK